MQPIIQHLFQANSLEDVSMERLEAFVEEYPSFGIGHFLLSRKLRVEDAGRYSGETQRTSLYFTNPFWLQWMLENSGTNNAGRYITPKVTAPETFVSETLISEPFVSEPFDATEEPGLAPEEPIRDEEPPFVLEETETPTVTETAIIAPEEPLPATGEPSPLQTAERPSVREESSSAAERLMQSLREAHGLREKLMQINGDLESFREGSDATTPQEEEEEPAPEEDETGENEPVFSAGAIGAAVERAALAAGRMEEEQKPAEQPITPSEQPITTTDQSTLSEQPITIEQSTPAAQHITPADHSITSAEEPIVFEPYHTIDYFASQGIKLTLDENPSDSLGKQLKSFTDWLKVMRRLPQKDREIVPDIAAERTVQTIAAHSIEGKEVLTETMAEVLAKQGMPEKAREVYNKLSLLNPGKRA